MKKILPISLTITLGICILIMAAGFGKVRNAVVKVKPGDDIQSIVNSNPDGTTFKFAAGTYRMQTIIPKDNDVFDGGNKAVLNGSRLLTNWIKKDNYWYIDGQTQEGLRVGEGRERAGHPRASYPEDVYVDDVPLLHAEHIGDVKPGTFLFDYKADRIYLGTDPEGHKVETSVSERAFKGKAKNVTIQNLIIEKYATPGQYGTVDSEFGPDWTVRDNVIQLNHGCGLNFGNGSKILRNKLQKNGHAGFGGGDNNWLFEGNDVRDNGWAGFDPVWEGGGGKICRTNSGIVRGNFVTGNYGPGIWLDIDADGITIENNVCWNNPVGPGIMFEVSSDAIIRNNTCANNATNSGMSQIYISSSSNGKVYGNTIDIGSAGGGAVIIANMHRPPSNPGINNEIYNNNIIIRSTGKRRMGIVNEYDPDSVAVYTKNSFHNNTYHLADLDGKYFTWKGKKSFSFAEMKAAGNEIASVADANLPNPNPDLKVTDTQMKWPELTEPPIDESQLNKALEEPTAGPALWFKFDETSGSMATDFSGFGNSGVLQGMDESTARVPGHSGNALSLDGKNDNVKAGPLGMFRFMTVAMWVNPSSLNREFNSLIHTDGWRKGTVHIMISGNGKIQMSINGNQGTDQNSENGIFTADNLSTWKHVAIVYNAEDKTVKFYIDGKLNSTRRYSKTVLANMGNFEVGGWSDGGRNFAGKLDDVRIYGRALSDNEIMEIAAGKN